MPAFLVSQTGSLQGKGVGYGIYYPTPRRGVRQHQHNLQNLKLDLFQPPNHQCSRWGLSLQWAPLILSFAHGTFQCHTPTLGLCSQSDYKYLQFMSLNVLFIFLHLAHCVVNKQVRDKYQLNLQDSPLFTSPRHQITHISSNESPFENKSALL